MALPSEVDAWLTLPEIAERLGLPVTRVRDLVRDGRLVALRADPGGPLAVPAAFVTGSGTLKGLTGVITLLRDAGFSDEGLVTWLFTADDTLPGTPAQALVENRGTEVKRRAQALA
jgi:hypothetical protein